KAAAQQALAGTALDRFTFLRTGQYETAEHDDRIEVAQRMEAGGPEVKGAAEIALAGPRSYLTDFLTTGYPKARQRDLDTATHVATVRGYVADAAASAATANALAAEAQRVAAVARNAAADAERYADRKSTRLNSSHRTISYAVF